MLSLDVAAGERGYAAEPADDRTPEALYERRWALALLERALADLRAEYGEGDRSALLEELRPFLVGGAPPATVAEASARLSMSEGAVRVAVHRLRGRFRPRLRARVAETVGDPDDVDEELRHLVAALSG